MTVKGFTLSKKLDTCTCIGVQFDAYYVLDKCILVVQIFMMYSYPIALLKIEVLHNDIRILYYQTVDCITSADVCSFIIP